MFLIGEVRARVWTWFVAITVLLVINANAVLTENQVLLVVNTNSPDSVAIGSFYTGVHPAVHVLELGVADSTQIDRTNFNTQIRNPIRSFLSSSGLASEVVAIATTKGFPYRVNLVGTDIGPVSLINKALYNSASVDSELTMLWQNLAASGTDSGSFVTNLLKGLAHNYVINPFYSTNPSISTFSRANIRKPKSFAIPDPVIEAGYVSNTMAPVANQFTPGDMYLVTRLSGFTVADVTNSIARSQNIIVDPGAVTVVLDKDLQNFDAPASHPFSGVSDFEATRDALIAAGYNVVFDATTNHIISAGHPVIAYASYGGNASINPGPLYIQNELMFTYAPGAMFNTYESFNGSDFSNPNHGNQGMVADFLLKGGSLGVGHVLEPFTFSVADNQILFGRMLTGGVCWAEAAWAAIPVLSWQNIVIGDPLAKIQVGAGPPVATLQFTATTYTVGEGGTNAVVRVKRSGDLSGTVKVDYETMDISATAGSDYLMKKGTLSFLAGAVTRSVAIPITNDSVKEPTETFRVLLSNPVGAVIGVRSNATVKITDND